MNWKMIFAGVVQVARQIPTAIALAACIVDVGEEILRGVRSSAEESPEEQEGLAHHVSTLVRLVQTLKKTVWPSPVDTDAIDVSAEEEFPFHLKIIPLRPDPCN